MIQDWQMRSILSRIFWMLGFSSLAVEDGATLSLSYRLPENEDKEASKDGISDGTNRDIIFDPIS